MLTSINPLGEAGRKQKWWLTFAAYVLGSIIGGALVGSMLGLIGSAVPGSGMLRPIAAGVLILGGAADSLRMAIPGVHRQVDENWLTKYRGWVYGWGFGFQLGMGIATIVPTALVYSMMALLLLYGDPFIGLALGAMFGFSRAFPLLLVRSASNFDRLAAVMARLEKFLPWSRRMPALAQFAAASIALLA